MNLRLLLLGGITMLSATTTFAQDEIYKRNGSVIEGRVKNVGKETVTYKKSDDAGSPEMEIDKEDVKKIEYEDGSVERFERESYRQRMRPAMPPMPPFMAEDMQERRRGRGSKNNRKYGNNVLALAPLQLSESGFGVGLSYERSLDKNGIVSFYMPVVFTFNGNSNYGYGNDINTFYAMPGIEIYPTGSKGIVKYSIGPSLVVAAGNEYRPNYYYGYPYYGNYGYMTSYYGGYRADRFMLGMMVNNSLNINPTEHLYLGLELGLGATYLNTIDGYNEGTTGLAQFGFKVGVRF